MQPYDIAMLAVLAGATLFGFYKGMAWQIASLASLVASYFVALRFSPLAATWFGRQQPSDRLVAMLVIYLATSLAIWIAFRMVSGMINRVKLTEFDRQAGALFGAAKGVLWCVALTFFAVSLSSQARDIILKSRSGYYIAQLIDHAETVMPREIHDVLAPYLRRLDDQLDPDQQPKSAAAPGQAAQY
jgi:membrane protein required for colicin V production